MRNITLENLPVNSPLKNSLYHKSGTVAHVKGEVIKPEYVGIMKECGITHLIEIDIIDNISEFLFKTKNKSIRVNDLPDDSTLAHPLFKEDGTLLLEKNIKISGAKKAGLLRQGIETLYIEKSESELEAKRIFDYKKKVRLLVAQKPSGANQESDNLRPKLEFKAVEMNDTSSLTNADEIHKSAPLDVKPSGMPLSDFMNKKDPFASRTMENKIEFVNSHNEIIRFALDLYGLFKDSEKVDIKNVDDLTKKVINGMVEDKEMFLNMLNMEKIDNYVVHHSLNTTSLAVNIATAMGFNQEQVTEVAYSAFLCDVGMTKIPENIIYKPAKLTSGETELIQKHPVYSFDLIKEKFHKIPFSTPLVAYQVHERCDGTGYPSRRGKTVIHKYAKVIALADIYDALISKRPWRPGHVPHSAVREILEMGNKQKLDIDTIKGFLKFNSAYPIGSVVQLNSGLKAKVISTNENDYTRPIVCTIENIQGKMVEKEKIDLAKNHMVEIVKVLRSDDKTDWLLKGF
jgi:HD-GYP domain-containing protein (c-di-GMP phosphodiesterase class II)